MYNSFFNVFLSISVFTIIFICAFIPTYYSQTTYDAEVEILDSGDSEFFWPIPGNYHFTSYFGKRKSPTTGASTYHSGVDVAATAGTKLYSCISGKVTLLQFKGAGGYTITVTSGNISVSFCHISPTFLVSLNDYVEKGQLIAKVGPKNVYGVLGNPYKDSSGNPTNGATTGCHLHLTIRKNGIAVNPLSFFNY